MKKVMLAAGVIVLAILCASCGENRDQPVTRLTPLPSAAQVEPTPRPEASAALAPPNPAIAPAVPESQAQTEAGSEEAPVLDTDDARMSYALGAQLGVAMRNAGLTPDLDLLVRGAQDSLNEKKLALPDDALRQTLGLFQQALKTRQEKERQEKMKTNVEEGKAFLDANAAKEGVVTLPSGLQYKILQEGTGPSPQPTDKVRLQFRGCLMSGEEFESTYTKNEPVEVRVDRNLKGVAEALPLMKEGAKWQLFIPGDLAFGLRGKGTKVGPNATVVYELELVKVLGQ